MNQNASQMLSKLSEEFNEATGKFVRKSDFNQQKSRIDDIEAKLTRTVVHGNRQRSNALGSQVTKSGQYAAFLKNRQIMDRVELGKIWAERKDLDPGAARDVLSANLLQGVFAPPRLRQVHLRNFLNVVPTSAEQIPYVVETGYTNAAAIRNEGAEAALSEISFDKATCHVKAVTHGVVLTKEQAADMPTLENFVENRMVNGIYHAEDDLILNGIDGIVGLMHVAGVQTYDRWVDGDTEIDTLRRAITMLQLIDFPAIPNLAIVNPEDWETMELAKDAQNRYIWVEVNQGGAAVMWRVPVLPFTAMDPGSFLIGDFMQACTLYDREAASVQIFNQHSDWALSGKLLLFGEERVGLAVQVPELLVKGTFAQGSGS